MKIDKDILVVRHMIQPNPISWGREYSAYVYKRISLGHYRLMFTIVSGTDEHNEFLHKIFNGESLYFINGTVGMGEIIVQGDNK